MNKTPDADPIIMEYIDPSLEWIVETRLTTVGHDDLGWMELDPQGT
jgi:hypothetical protein